MKKTLVALAAFAATASFAQVTITGLFDAGPRISNFRGAAITQVVANNTATSNVTFLGTENLGGGLTANLRWEIDVNPAQTAAMSQGTPASPDNPNIANYAGNGYSFVGLTSASAGTINFGTINTATLDANGIGNPFGTALGSGYKSLAIGATRYQQALEYITPTMSGFSAKALVAFKDQYQNLASTGSVPAATSQQTGNGRDGAQELSLKYSQGPLNLIVSNLVVTSYYSQSNNTGSTVGTNNSALCTAAPGAQAALATYANQLGGVGNTCTDGNNYTVNTVAGNYKYGNYTGYAWFQTQKANGVTNTVSSTTGADILSAVDRTAKGFAVAFAASPTLNLMAGYRQITRNAGENYLTSGSTASATAPTAGGIGNVTKLTAFGADYALSKLTSVYARYENIKDDAQLYNTLAVSGTGYNSSLTSNKITNTAVGIRMAF